MSSEMSTLSIFDNTDCGTNVNVFYSSEHVAPVSYVKPVGYWVLYKDSLITTRFPIYKKPTGEQIKNTEDLLGWTWEDAL